MYDAWKTIFICSIRIQRLPVWPYLTQFLRCHHNQTYYRPTQVINNSKLWFQETAIYWNKSWTYYTNLHEKLSSAIELLRIYHLYPSFSMANRNWGATKKTYPVHQVPITPLKSTAFSISLLKLDPLIHADFCHKQKVSKGKSPGLPQMCFQQTHEDIWRFFSAETSSPTLRSRPWFRSWTTFLRKPEDGVF